jgi:lactoylglutathione lyase
VHLHHANIRASDPNASIAFYRALGFEVVGAMRMPGLYTVYLGAPEGQAVIELSVKEEPDESWSTAPGSGHIAISVADLDAELTRLAALGIEPESPAFHPGGRTEAWVAFVRDPDDNRVELVNGEFAPPHDELPAGVG